MILAPLTASAATDLVTVERVQRTGPQQIKVTGIAAGATTAQAYQVYNPSPDPINSCERLALIALTHPGRYTFTIDGTTCALTYNPPPSP